MAKDQGCWAASLGGCDGGITGEHLVSKCLFEKEVTLRGFTWCPDEFKTIPIARLVSNCLCKEHNGRLSPCDAEAKRWREAVHWLMQGTFLPGEGPLQVRSLSGHLFARWLAKTACNIAASSNEHVPAPLARYAFSDDDDPRVHLYLWTAVGTKLEMDPSHIGVYWVHSTTDPDAVLVCFLFYGLPLVLSTIPIDGAEAQVAQTFGIELAPGQGPLERPREIRSDTSIAGFGKVTRGRLSISWPTPAIATQSGAKRPSSSAGCGEAHGDGVGAVSFD